jgi:hypothetical protein
MRGLFAADPPIAHSRTWLAPAMAGFGVDRAADSLNTFARPGGPSFLSAGYA